MASTSDHTNSLPMFQHPPKSTIEPSLVPMDIDIQNAQTAALRSLPQKDVRGCLKCFYCNNYGHIKKYCFKLKATQQVQNVQIALEETSKGGGDERATSSDPNLNVLFQKISLFGTGPTSQFNI